MTKIQDQTIYDVLSNAIADHHLAPDTHLPEDELANSFNVSRTRIRKILQRLASEQLITLKPNRGAFVASLSIKEAQDVFTARRIVESGLIKCISFPLKKKQITLLTSLIKKEHDAICSGNRRLANRLSGEFHLTIAEFAHNDSLYQYLEQLIARTSLAIAMYHSPNSHLCDNHCHQNLLSALLNQSPDEIAKQMCEHLTNIEQGLDFSDKPEQKIGDVLSQLNHSRKHNGL